MSCLLTKTGYCDKIKERVNPLFCLNKCKGNYEKWVIELERIKKGQPVKAPLPYEGQCGQCEWFRRGCKYPSGFCLLLTRMTNLLKHFRNGLECPKGKVDL